MSDIAFMTASDLGAAYAGGALSPVEVARAVLARIDAVDPVLNAFCHRDDEAVLADAAVSQARWRAGAALSPLDGVPLSIKDLMAVRGWPMREGSLTTGGAPCEADDPAVAFLRAAGCVIVGKTTTPEFGNSGVTDSPLTGLTVNPWDTGRTPGGSSGGGVAAVAAGCGPLALGSDGGGSVRTPCSFTNLVGLKPTFGRVPQSPGDHFGRLSVSGPMTRTVRDAALMMNAMGRHWRGDWHSLADDGVDHTARLEEGIEGLRIACSATLGFSWCEPEILDGFAAAVETLRRLGAVVEEVDPDIPDPTGWFNTLWSALAAEKALGMDEAARGLMGHEMQRSLQAGSRIAITDYYDARRRRTALIKTMDAFHGRHDLIVTPAASVVAFPTGHDAPPDWPLEDDNYETYAMVFNATGQPAVTVPCGFTDAGLPFGLQIAGRRCEDALVLRAARAYEAANPLYERRPPPGLTID